MALAVGILVDDATVEIENIHRNLAMQKPIRQAILDGAQQIAVAAFVSTLSICIVFVPVFALGGVVGLAVLAAGARGGARDAGLVSALANADPDDGAVPAAGASSSASAPKRARRAARADRRACTGACKPRFDRLQRVYEGALAAALGQPPRGPARLRRLRARVARCSRRSSAATSSRPSTRDSSGSTCARRPERASRRPSTTSQRVEDRIRTVIPPDEIAVDPRQHRHARTASTWRSPTARRSRAADGEILVSLKPGHGPTADYLKELRDRAAARVPRAHLLRPAGGHGQPDPELRAARADRRADQRPERRAGRELRGRAADRRAAARRSPARWTCTSTRCSTARGSQFDVDRALALESGLSQRDVAPEPADLAHRQRHDQHELLAQPEERRQLSRRRSRRRSTGSTSIERAAEHAGLVRAVGAPPLLSNLAHGRAHDDAGRAEPLQRAAGLRRVRQRAGNRPRHASPTRSSKVVAEFRGQALEGEHHLDARPGAEHERGLRRPRARASRSRSCSSTS